MTEYRTSDLNLVATLLQHDVVHDALEYDADVKSVFWVYDSSARLRTVITSYALGEARVEPQHFSRSFVALKDEMFAFLNEQRSGASNSDGR